MSCVWLNYMVQYFQYKNCVGSSPKTKKMRGIFFSPWLHKNATFEVWSRNVAFFVFE